MQIDVHWLIAVAFLTSIEEVHTRFKDYGGLST